MVVLCVSCGGTKEPAVIDATAEAYVDAVNAGDFARAAALFHYPEEDSALFRQAGQDHVANVVRALDGCFGAPLDVKPGYTGIVFELAAGGGDLAHWRRHPGVRSIVLGVAYQKLGKGRLAFDLVQGDDRTWTIRQVKYGLPLSDVRTKPRIARCAKQVADVP